MKLPRWLVVSLLTSSALAVFGAGAWWWVTWPKRTISAFTALLAHGHLDQANRLIRPPGRLTARDSRIVVELSDGTSRLDGLPRDVPFGTISFWRSSLENKNAAVKWESRTMWDGVLGRAQFTAFE